MKKIILLVAISFVVISSCKKEYGQRGDACISANKTTAAISETITISNCGDELPSQYVEAELNWGDGTITKGQTGSHSYSSTGTFTIKLLLNGDDATAVADVDPAKVKIDVIIQ
jgi:hypothetical protein